jgi:hypothetical protein
MVDKQPLRMARLVVLVTASALVVGFFPPAAQAADPVGTSPCPGVRPGALMEDATSNVYTMGFFFTAKDKSVYFATVGDLILSAPGTKVWRPGKGPIVRDESGRRVGRFVYAYRRDTPDAASFGLVRIEPKIKWTGRVCHFGGPTGTFSTRARDPIALQLYGQGFPFFFGIPARTATAAHSSDPEWLHAQGPVAPFDLGDAGAPVLTGGRAAGIVTGAVGGAVGVPASGGFQIARLGPWVSRAQKALKLSLRLQTSRAA